MTINNNKDIIKLQIIFWWIRQFFCMLYFYHWMRFQLYLISHLHILILIYQIDIFYMNKFYHSNILDFRYLIRPTATINNTTYNHFYMNPRHLIIYTHTYIYYYSIFDLNFIYIYSTHVYAHTVHVELKILFHFPLTLS